MQASVRDFILHHLVADGGGAERVREGEKEGQGKAKMDRGAREAGREEGAELTLQQPVLTIPSLTRSEPCALATAHHLCTEC